VSVSRGCYTANYRPKTGAEMTSFEKRSSGNRSWEGKRLSHQRRLPPETLGMGNLRNGLPSVI
jgi:hypothetical protein